MNDPVLCPHCHEWTEIDEDTGTTCCCDVRPYESDPDLDLER